MLLATPPEYLASVQSRRQRIHASKRVVGIVTAFTLGIVLYALLGPPLLAINELLASFRILSFESLPLGVGQVVALCLRHGSGGSCEGSTAQDAGRGFLV